MPKAPPPLPLLPPDPTCSARKAAAAAAAPLAAAAPATPSARRAPTATRARRARTPSTLQWTPTLGNARGWRAARPQVGPPALLTSSFASPPGSPGDSHNAPGNRPTACRPLLPACLPAEPNCLKCDAKRPRVCLKCKVFYNLTPGKKCLFWVRRLHRAQCGAGGCLLGCPTGEAPPARASTCSMQRRLRAAHTPQSSTPTTPPPPHTHTHAPPPTPTPHSGLLIGGGCDRQWRTLHAPLTLRLACAARLPRRQPPLLPLPALLCLTPYPIASLCRYTPQSNLRPPSQPGRCTPRPSCLARSPEVAGRYATTHLASFGSPLRMHPLVLVTRPPPPNAERWLSAFRARITSASCRSCPPPPPPPPPRRCAPYHPSSLPL